MTVHELNRAQLDELKVKYLFDCFENYGTVPSHKDVAEATGIPDGLIILEYDGIEFTEEDFSVERRQNK